MHGTPKEQESDVGTLKTSITAILNQLRKI